jgi:hypothetical protein
MVRGWLVTTVEADARLTTAPRRIQSCSADLLPRSLLLQPGDVVNAVGTPDVRGEVVLAERPSGVVLLGDPGDDDGDSRSGRLDDGGAGVSTVRVMRRPALTRWLVAGRSPVVSRRCWPHSLAGAAAAAFAPTE